MAQLVDRLTTREASPAAAVDADKPVGGPGGFTLIRQDRYLMLIAALMVFVNLVNTSGEYLFGRYVVEQANALYGTGADAAAATGALRRGNRTANCSAR